jgi:hypothetical protein
MMDHHPSDTPETGPWPMGWAVAAGAGALAFVLCVAIGGASFAAGLAIGLVSFGVFGVLLGAGGVERTGPSDSHEGGGDHH